MMNTLRQLRSFWIPSLTAIALVGFNDAVAQTSYEVTDLGTLEAGFFGCSMGVNNQGWTETQYGLLEPSGALAKGQVAINVGGLTIDLGTLGGPNSWDNPFGGEINDRGEAVGYSETDVPDPNGEDICGFGTHLTCRAFLWRSGHMSALPTLGGNNAQASAMNNRGQITGFAEDGTVDSSCPANATNNRIQRPVIWEQGKAHALPTVGKDPDGEANSINDQGEAVGYSGTCPVALHAVLWRNERTVLALPDLGNGGFAFSINNQGQIVGTVGSADGTTEFAALWRNGVLTNLGTLPGDFAAIAGGINNKGQVVGSTLDSNFSFVHAFIWQDGVMTNLATLFPTSSNLFPTMANSINSAGKIAGMGTVLSGPHAGETHAFLATPVNARMDASVADVAPTYQASNLSPTAGTRRLAQKFRLSRFGP
jgi:probable HAF family extracellular repeat protein